MTFAIKKNFYTVSAFFLIYFLLINLSSSFSEEVKKDNGLNQSNETSLENENNQNDNSILKRENQINENLKSQNQNLKNQLSAKEQKIDKLNLEIKKLSAYGVDNNFLVTKNILFIIVILLLFLLIIVSILLLRSITWRKNVIDKVIEKGNVLQFPHETNEIIKNSQSNIYQIANELSNFVAEHIQAAKDSSSQSLEKFNNINEQLSIFNKMINETESDLKRYREGYDFVIKKNYINLLIKISSICKSENNPGNTLLAVDELIDDYLEGENVKKYELELNKSIQGQKETRTISIDTDDREKAGFVTENIEYGYEIVMPQGEKILKPALVKILKYQNKENNNNE